MLPCLQSLLERQQHPDMTTARRLSDLDEKQRLETDELRHPLLAYLRLHIQSKPQKHEPELLHSTQWETTLL